MTDETQNLVLEILKRLQADFVLMREDIHGVRSEMASLKHHMAAFMSHEITQDSEIAAVKLRLERIERRLDLID